MKKTTLGILIITIISCSPRVVTKITQTIPPLDYKEEVMVIGIEEETPLAAMEIGTVKIGDTGFSNNCGWDVVIEQAKVEVRKAGGNILKIVSHIPPSFMGSSCDRVTAKIMKIENLDTLHKFSKVNKTTVIDSTWNYAKLHVYRTSGMGALVGYNLYLGDSLLCRVKSNSFQEIKIMKKGMNTLWAKTETKVEVPITIEFGKEYYLKCGLQMGIMVGRPKLELVDAQQGKFSIQALKSKKNNTKK